MPEHVLYLQALDWGKIHQKQLIKALREKDVRFLVSSTLYKIIQHEDNPSEIQAIVSELIGIINNHSIQKPEYSVLEEIFKLKDLDIRRSAIYILGEIGLELKRRNTYPKIQEEIVSILTTIISDRQENLELRWMAAAGVQNFSIDMNWFFSEEKLINPGVAIVQSLRIGLEETNLDVSLYDVTSRYERLFVETLVSNSEYEYLLNQYGFNFVDGGLVFDIYSYQYIYDTRTGCGAGLPEVYNTLKRLLNRSKQ